MMTLVLVVAVVGITAAWFGNVNQQQAKFEIPSDTITAYGSIDFKADAYSGENLYPALATPGFFLRTGNEAPTGETLLTESEELGIKRAAKVYTIYFDIIYIGPVDAIDGAVVDNSKTVKLSLQDVKIKTSDDAGEDTSYLSEFNCEFGVVKNTATDDAPIYEDFGNTPLYANANTLSNHQISYKMLDTHTLGLCIEPNVTYTIKFEMYFNKIDEECDQELLNKMLSLTLNLNTEATISRSDLYEKSGEVAP